AGSCVAPVRLAGSGARGALAISGSILPILSLIIYGRIGATDRVSVIDEELVRLVRRVDVFAQLPLTALERLASGMTKVAAAQGEGLVREGDSGDTFVIVASGGAEGTANGARLGRLGAGAGRGGDAV